MNRMRNAEWRVRNRLTMLLVPTLGVGTPGGRSASQLEVKDKTDLLVPTLRVGMPGGRSASRLAAKDKPALLVPTLRVPVGSQGRSQ